MPERGWSRASALAEMRACHARAVARHGLIERTFRVAGLAVRARFAGPALVPAIEPALAHLLAAATAHADLDVELWDSASTGIAVPSGRPNGDDRRILGFGAEMERVRSSYHVVPRILTLYDPDQRQAVIWVPDARLVPSNEVASPMRTLLHWWARDHGLQFVHAGAIGRDGLAVLLAGPSGSGKSTTALAGLLGGLDYLGDDYVLIDARGGTTIHSLFSAAKLQPEQVDAFPELRPALTNAASLDVEKALWFVQNHFPDRTRRSAEAVAVLVPRVTGRPLSAIAAIQRSKALAALAPSTLAQLSGADAWSMRAIAGFLEQVPAFELQAGTDLRALAATVAGIVDSMDAA